MLKSIHIFLVLLLLLAFPPYGKSQEIIQVATDSETPIYLSHLAEKVTPLRLYSYGIAIGHIAQINIDKEDIFVSDVESNLVYRFNREGELLNLIGIDELGQAEGYNYASRFCLDSLTKKVFLLTDNGLYIYNYEGELLDKKVKIRGREIQLIGENIYVNNPQLNQIGNTWKAWKTIKVYERDSLKLKYTITYSDNNTEPYISVLRNRTIEYTFSHAGEHIYIYQPEFIGTLKALKSTVFSLSDNLLKPSFKLEFENSPINKETDIVIKNIFLTKRFIFCEFERQSDNMTRTFCQDQTTGLGITTLQGFWDDIENTEAFTRLSPISTNDNLFYFLRRENNIETQNVILYLVELKN